MDMYAKYEAAGRLLTQHTRTAVLNGRPSITWVDGSRFFYMRQIPGKEGVKRVRVQVDAATGREWAKETYGPLEEHCAHLRICQGYGLGAGADKACHASGIPDDVPCFIVHNHSQQHITRKHLALDRSFLTILDFHNVLQRHADLQNLVLHSSVFHAFLDIGLDLVFIP